MFMRTTLVAATVAFAAAAGPAGAADLGGNVAADPDYYDRYAYNADPYADDDLGTPRRRYRRQYRERSRDLYRGRYRYQSSRRDYGPRRPAAFNRVRDDLVDAGYSRIAYRDERTDRYGERVYLLTACQNGVRYRMHVTEACEVELKRRAGYCRSSYFY